MPDWEFISAENLHSPACQCGSATNHNIAMAWKTRTVDISRELFNSQMIAVPYVTGLLDVNENYISNIWYLCKEWSKFFKIGSSFAC